MFIIFWVSLVFRFMIRCWLVAVSQVRKTLGYRANPSSLTKRTPFTQLANGGRKSTDAFKDSKPLGVGYP
jgi:hypothetical protein